MGKVPLENKHLTATFFAKFASDIGHQERDCPTVSLYQTAEGEFFVVEQGSPLVAPSGAEVINYPLVWLNETTERIKNYLPAVF